jgi:hypothetical protein
MVSELSVDFGTIALLAVVVWLDGWRRLPADALLISRAGFGPWSVRAPSGRAGPFALTAWWAPVVVPLLLAPESQARDEGAPRWKQDFDIALARGRRRLRRVTLVTGMLRLLGTLLILGIIVGIPIATARFGAEGLIYGVGGAFVLAIEMTLVTTVALGSLGIPFRRGFCMAAQLLSPFTAPRAPEIIAGAAIGPLHSLAPVLALLGEPRFLAWVRPWAYDELAGRSPDTGDETVAALVRTLPRTLLERAVDGTAHEADEGATHYCPRCTRTYRDVTGQCSNCSDLPLLAVGEAALRRVSV